MKSGIRTVWVIGLALLIYSTEARAAIVNGGFEAGSFLGWTTTGSTSIATAAFGSGPTSGSFDALMTSSGGSVAAASLETFLGLAPGTLTAMGNGTVTEGSAIKQTFSAVAGDVLSFKWNFLTDEVTPSGFNDFALWTLSTVNTGVELADTGSTFVISPTVFDEETGFGMGMHIFALPGIYTLGFAVVDVGDTAEDSGLLIDDVTLITNSGPAVPEPTSLVLLGTCLGGLVSVRLRQQKRKLVS